MKKYLPLFSILLLFCAMLSLWLFPFATSIFGLTSLLFSMTISIHVIFEKHKEAEDSRPKIAKDTLVFILTILLIALLSGIAAMLANFYVSLSFGVVVGLVSAIAVSFAVGYFVKKGMGRLM